MGGILVAQGNPDLSVVALGLRANQGIVRDRLIKKEKFRFRTKDGFSGQKQNIKLLYAISMAFSFH